MPDDPPPVAPSRNNPDPVQPFYPNQNTTGHIEETAIERKQKPSTFVTPKLEAEQKLGKSNFSINIKASGKEVTGGIKYNF